jgi:molecular chaperone HtpG
MTSALVSLPQLEVKWSRPDQPLVVGKDILELLSTSMYVDSMSMYREYIQNSADAVELAQTAGVLQGRGRAEIRVDQSARTVLIRDNGSGLGKEQFFQQLTALGGSKKRGTRARGFRGVGRLAGLAFCQELIFRSRQEGENTVHELRWDSREVRSLLRSADNSSDLRDIISRTIQTREVAGRSSPSRFFEVELRGMVRHRDDRLLNEEVVTQYLAQVSPVPFSPDFQFADQIRSFLETHGVRLGTIDVEINGRGPVYRPHQNSMAMGKSGETHFQELTTIYTPGRDGDVAAATWILHHDYRGGLPSNSLVEGWRLRCGDIQVGDNSLLQTLFPESRFNGWCVAETHVLDPRILPNGRRDHFEQNAYYFDLINHLAPHARDIAQRCRTSSIARNLVRSIEASLAECQQNLRVIEKGVIDDATASKLTTKLKGTLEHLQRQSSRSGISSDQRVRYQGQIKRLQQRVLRLNAAQRGDAIFVNFTADQRTILTEVFNAIYQSTDDLQRAQRLVDKIVSRLNRKRSVSRSQPKKSRKR